MPHGDWVSSSISRVPEPALYSWPSRAAPLVLEQSNTPPNHETRTRGGMRMRKAVHEPVTPVQQLPVSSVVTQPPTVPATHWRPIT